MNDLRIDPNFFYRLTIHLFLYRSVNLLPLSIGLSAKWDPHVISNLQPRTKNVTSDIDRIEQALAGKGPSSGSNWGQVQPWRGD